MPFVEVDQERLGGGLVATVMKSVPDRRSGFGNGAGGDEGAEFVVGEWLDHRRLDAGCLHARKRVGVDVAAGGEPGREAADGELADAGGAGAAPASSSPAIQELRAARLIGRWSCSVHQRM